MVAGKVITTTDKQRAVLLTIGLCCIEAVMVEEKPQSFVHNKLNAARINLAKATDDFVSHSFQGNDMEKALSVYEATKQHVERLFRLDAFGHEESAQEKGEDGKVLAA